MNVVVTRFPPSPTGYLHIGGARTALFNWLFARQRGGKFILRIEDTDIERSKEEYTRSIMQSLKWLELDWDEGPYFQSQRMHIYLKHVQKLLDEGKAYHCHCQPEELDAKRQAALADGRKPMYDRRCRDLGLGKTERSVVRLKAPLIGQTSFRDIIKGVISFDNKELDDLVILRSDETATYHLAVVVDDVTMGVTHIIRGDDHVNNTPRQILIFQALGYPLPQFAHVPMILGSDKTRLSKRHGATSVLAYQEMGYLPQALLNYLARLGWSFGDEEVFSREDLIAKFSLENVGKSAGVFNPEKLTWLNSHWIRESDADELVPVLSEFLEKRGVTAEDRDYLREVIKTLQPRSKTMVEMADGALFYFEDIHYEPKAAQKFLKPDLLPVLTELLNRLAKLDQWSEKGMASLFAALAEQYQLKVGDIAQAVRVALTGKSVSPGIYEVINLLGKERSKKRLADAINWLQARVGEHGTAQRA
jgi:glutamyl-tRNA synthetase